MKSDFDIISRSIKSENAVIYPISDVHLGDFLCREKEWQEFCSRIISEKNAYIILAGDMINNATKSSVSNVYDEVMRPQEQKYRMCGYLEPIKNRIICAVSGNHEDRSLKDADDSPMYDIMCKLNIEDLYRPNMSFAKVSVGNTKKQNTYMICAMHTGSSIKRNEDYSNMIDGIDIMIYGHTHKGSITKPSKIIFDAHNNRITQKDIIVMTAQSWLSYGGYASRKQLSASSPAQNSNMQRLLLSGVNGNKSIKIIW